MTKEEQSEGIVAWAQKLKNAQTYLQLPLRQLGAGNVYLLVLPI